MKKDFEIKKTEYEIKKTGELSGKRLEINITPSVEIFSEVKKTAFAVLEVDKHEMISAERLSLKPGENMFLLKSFKIIIPPYYKKGTFCYQMTLYINIGRGEPEKYISEISL
jgi:hypothetical protein